MFNPLRMLRYFGRVLIAVLAMLFILLALSLIAVSIATTRYNQAIVTMCTVSLPEKNWILAADKDGIVNQVAVTYRRVGETLDTTVKNLYSPATTPSEPAQVFLSDIVPATSVGGHLMARLHILDTIAEGFYNIELTFTNNDVPLAQTATCYLTVQVTKVRSLDGVNTIMTVQNVKDARVTADTDPLPAYLIAKAIGGMLPGIAAVAIAFRLCGEFVNALYKLGSLKEALQFLWYRNFGRPKFSPFLIIQEGSILLGKDSVKQIGGPAGLVIHQDSAVITEKEGKLARVLIGPCFPRLEPFEKIWDIIDFRPQRWPFKVSAVTRDGIPITYEVAIKFRVPKVEKDDAATEENVRKAATCKWIREAWRTEAERVMDWVKRVIIGATEGIMRTEILATYQLDELLDADVRRQIRQDLLSKLSTAAQAFGVEIMEVTLQDIEFEGQVLQEWASTWKARRDLEIQKIEADERVQELQMRQRAESQVRQEMLDSTIKILTAMTKDSESMQISDDYVLLSFINMVEQIAAAQKVFIPEDLLLRLERIKEKLR